MDKPKSAIFQLTPVWLVLLAYIAGVLVVSISTGSVDDRLLGALEFMLPGAVAVQLAIRFDRYRLGAFLLCVVLLAMASLIKGKFGFFGLLFVAIAGHSLWPASSPAGSRMTLPDFENNSLPWAVSRGDWNLAKHLIVTQSVDPNGIVCGFSPLGIARFRQDEAMALMLKRCGAVVDVINE